MAGPNTGRGGLTVRQQLMHKMAAVSDQYRIKPVLELAVESERARRAQMRQRQDFRRKPRPGAGDEIEADTRRLDAAMMHSINPKCGRCGALLMTNRVKLCGGDVCLKTLKDQELLERLRVEREDFIARRAVQQTPGLDEDEDDEDDESLGDEDTDEDYDEDDEDEEEDEDDEEEEEDEDDEEEDEDDDEEEEEEDETPPRPPPPTAAQAAAIAHDAAEAAGGNPQPEPAQPPAPRRPRNRPASSVPEPMAVDDAGSPPQ